jgi:crossover junction endodeoxyribonuclease RuvC
MLLALDLGTKSGWATYDNDGVIKSGVVDFKAGKYENTNARYFKFRTWLSNISPTPTHIVYEAVRKHVATDAAHAYGAFMGNLITWCDEYVVPCNGADVGTVKKFWTGKGNSNKIAMIAEGHKRGWNKVTDDNEMDALAILHYWMEHGIFSLK